MYTTLHLPSPKLLKTLFSVFPGKRNIYPPALSPAREFAMDYRRRIGYRTYGTVHIIGTVLGPSVHSSAGVWGSAGDGHVL